MLIFDSILHLCLFFKFRIMNFFHQNSRKILHFIFGLLLLSSCSMPSFQKYYKSSKDLDLYHGKWLVTKVHTDFDHYKEYKINEQFVRKLQKIGGDSIIYIESVAMNYIIPKNLPFKLEDKSLGFLKNTTDFDFIINIKASQIKSDVGDIVLLDPVHKEESIAELHIVAYDIKLKREIYNLKVTGSIEIDSESQIWFAKSSGKLLDTALNKAIKDLKKYSKKYRN